MKRTADETGASMVAGKRQRRGSLQHSTIDGNDHDEDAGSEFDFEFDDDESVAPSQTPLTSVSAASTPRFPSDLKTIKCTYPGCKKTFNRPARLAAHLRSHTNERPFSCSYPGCDKSYMEEKHLKQHVKGTHTGEREHICTQPGCGKSFLTSTRLRRHQAVHEGQERFKCRDFPPCEQSFRKHQTLQRHIRTEHLKVAAFPCTQAGCRAAFETPAALRRHNERDHGELRFWCEECGDIDSDGSRSRVGFPTMELLQRHMQKTHINCMFCDRVFASRGDLDGHIEAQHSKSTLGDRKSVACDWPGCNKTFVKKANLLVHVRSAHQGQRFICGEIDLSATEDLKDWSPSEGCGNGFVTKGNLEDHVRYVHLGVPRPQAKSAAKPKERVVNDILGELSGTSTSARLTIACPSEGCTLRFANAADVAMHIKNQHPDEVQGDMGEDGVFLSMDIVGNLEGPSALEPPVSGELPGLTSLEDWNANGEFWIGGDLDADLPVSQFDQQWLSEEAEMRRLIGDDDLEGLIDPAIGV